MMDENEEQLLDLEYERYLEIMRPYLQQLHNPDVIEISNAWIQRLSCCKQSEKVLRNKHIFALCYQLSKGILEEPFLRNPTTDELAPLQEGTVTDTSFNDSSEMEYLALDLISNKTKVLYDKNNTSPESTHCSECSVTEESNEFHIENKKSVDSIPTYSAHKNKQTIMCFNCPNISPRFPNDEVSNDKYYDKNEYEHRAAQLIMKLREIKTQNLMLQKELMTLKKVFKLKHTEKSQNNIMKVHNATSVHLRVQDSSATLNCLKLKLQEVQDSRKSLIETISELQDKLDNFNEIKRHEIEDLHAQHRLEIIQVKTSVREECKVNNDKNVEQLKQQHEILLKDIETKYLNEKENLAARTEAIIAEKDKTIQSMETEITNLKNNIVNLKNNQNFILSSFLDSQNSDLNSKCVTQKAKELEKRLNKMEKSKIKYAKAYEANLASLQKDKHLAECSLQLQLMKQRTQIINETSDEHETELTTALDKLESKYRDIVASVQATAVQRRIQDQMALESIIQTVCGIQNEGTRTNIAQRTYTDQLANKAMRAQTRDTNRSCDTELPTIIRDNKVGSIIVGNKTFAGENVLSDYCSDGENYNELFERVYVPQRDTGESSFKK